MTEPEHQTGLPALTGKGRVAHFLLTPNLQRSPPNDALRRVFLELGFELDMFAPLPSKVEPGAGLGAATYSYRWLIRNLLNPRWRHYKAVSCTSEDPIVVAGLLAFFWRKPLIFLSDEIKSGAYRGDRSRFWKKLCRWCMRRAAVTIVNDHARINLQRDYAGMSEQQTIVVYPGCFLEPPRPTKRTIVRQEWGVDDDQVALCFSGACNLSAGIDWALESLHDHENVKMITQALTIDGLPRYLLQNHKNADRIHIQPSVLSWEDAWSSMGGADVGIAIYTNTADQFQLMGVSSNRLCMFLAMGVPVIVSRQPSFQFVEDFDCGVMVENADEFSAALGKIMANNKQMKANALKCASDYIDTAGKFSNLKSILEGKLK